jgi:hypothetical protein
MSKNSKSKGDKQIALSKKSFEKEWPEIQEEVAKHQFKRSQYKARYGNIKRQITADFQGHKFVAVGNKLYSAKSWKTFPDFLVDFLGDKLTAAWGSAEIAKPDDEKHQIIKLYQQFCYWQQKQTKEDDGIYSSKHSGVSAAYLQLAYDLYALDHDSKLQEEVIKRLKNKSEYQGARYELTVAATFLRAGFDIEYEDETDKSNKHPEFIATHKSSGQKIAVEAKSRHRQGILDQPGMPKDESKVKASINRILNSALKKEPDHPFIVCIDLNMPPIKGNVFETEVFKEVLRTIDAKEANLSEPDGFPATMYIFTNYPHHYADSEQLDPTKTFLSILVKKPKYTFADENIVHEICKSLTQYRNIPNEFD